MSMLGTALFSVPLSMSMLATAHNSINIKISLTQNVRAWLITSVSVLHIIFQSDGYDAREVWHSADNSYRGSQVPTGYTRHRQLFNITQVVTLDKSKRRSSIYR